MQEADFKNIVFLGSKDIGYECLLHIIEHKKPLKLDIIGVLSNENKHLTSTDKSIYSLCKKHEISVLNNLEELFKLDHIDFLLSVQYHQILKEKHLKLAKKLAINLHMAPLPEYRGCNQFSFAIIDQSKIFGTTLHVMNVSVDAGDILFESRFDIPEGINVKDLYELTYQKSIVLFKDNIRKVFEGDYIRTKQSELVKSRLSSYHARNEMATIKKIDLSWEDEKILRYYRATYFPPFDPPYAIKQGEKVLITPKWIAENINE